MDPIPVWVRRLWDVWGLRLLVLLSLSLQIIFSLFGNRRKYKLSPWISILLWSAYLIADWVATFALGKLSDAQGDYDNGNALRAIWAPLLLLHLGGSGTITAYSFEDIHLWKRHLLGLVVQLFVAVYVILMSWNHSWFSIMSIPALVAGFIKYGERTWVLKLVSRDKSGEIVPLSNVGSENLGNNNTLEDKNSILVLCAAQKCVKPIKGLNEYTLHEDIWDIRFGLENGIELDDIRLFWNVIEVEMGLMFDLLYTKAPINFRKGGWILRCITFSCTMTVLIGLILRLIFTGEDREKWHKVDIVITEVLLVGALALEIYAIISLYLFSDWAMLWLINHNRAKQVIQLRKIKSWLFLPKQYRCDMVRQFDLLDYWVKNHISITESDQNSGRRILGSYFKKLLNKYEHKSAVIVPSLLFDPILNHCRCLNGVDHVHSSLYWTAVADPIFSNFLKKPLDVQILMLHIATEVCYNLEMEWETPDASDDQNRNRDSTVSQRHMVPPSGSSLSWEENRKLCRTLSRYMMYLFFNLTSLLPITASGDLVSKVIPMFSLAIGGLRDVRAACRFLLESDVLGTRTILNPVRNKQKDERWDMLKMIWVRLLLDAAGKGQRNEHLQQLSQGGEFFTFLWFFLPQSRMVSRDMSLEGQKEHRTMESRAPAPHLIRQRTWPPV